jgi:predicted AlkP superfamily pyrophosphatase or phosphodiesterase
VSRRFPWIAVIFVLAAGLGALAAAYLGGWLVGAFTGLVSLAVALFVAWATGDTAADGPPDPDRRRLLAFAGLGGALLVAGGVTLGATAKRLARPKARPIQQAMATGLGAEYMELVRRAYHPERSGDLQLLLAPFNSSNYPQESLSLVPQDPRTSHASVWMYLERIPLVVYGPGVVEGPTDSTDRVTLADIAPTTAELIGFDAYPNAERAGRPLPGLTTTGVRPKVVVTFVIDGGGWNVLDHWAGRWPQLERLMRQGTNYRNAIHGSFPAVTACAHATIGTGTYPNQHGITGHNIRDGAEVRKAFGTPGAADPKDIMVPTLADLWSEQTGNRAWVGELGYQVWHLGMLGYGGPDRPLDAKPVGVFWNEDGGGGWAPHNPDLYRLPNSTPGLDVFERRQADFTDPEWDAEFKPKGGQAPCCIPPIAEYQGDLIEATFASEPIGQGDTTDLLYINFKSPDYTGHIYGMASKWEGLMLEAVDREIGRLVDILEARYPGEYVLIVTADHGQCPLPDAAGGVRLDPIQLDTDLKKEFGGFSDVVQEVVPSEVYLNTDALWEQGATVEDVAAFLQDYPYRRNIGPYVPRDAIEQDLLDRQQFSAVFANTYLDTIDEATVETFGETAYPEGDEGIPTLPV